VALILHRRGHKVGFVARGSRQVCSLLESYGIEYLTYGKPSKTKYGKMLQLPFQLLRSLGPLRELRPDILVGFGTMEVWMGALLRKPRIVFDDAEPRLALERLSWLHLTSAVITPACYRKDLGDRHIRMNGYKELAYLHPNHFKPDPGIYGELGLTADERFIVARFGSFNAVHDFRRRGFSMEEKYSVVETLSKHARVFISPEGDLPPDLEPYRLPVPYHRIHHVLHFANLLIADTGTMAWEAAVLGTPAVVCGSFSSEFGNFVELERTYGLLYCFQRADAAIQKALELLQQPNLKGQWALKRDKLLGDKTDAAQFIAEFVEDYARRRSRIGESSAGVT
jgi:hypothetical protein